MFTFLQAAGEVAPQAPGQGGFWIMIVAMILVMWLFIWRPESKRRKEMAKFRDSMVKGTKVITAGGIHGKVREVKESYVVIEVCDNVTLRVDKNMIMASPEAQPQQNK
ncbi:MAG: preprotein translocase subunit YajC [Rikenellaceae bacterium]|nr:preprotein translocase subunit YajC [Rikenellaceae bacterium]MBP3682812.1 preprotein translocase subunit YajC [Rikenellaceae bacterium]MBQ6691020.1 preprotein translocase subunit YajC [Rikenellaceae bacterium]MBQ7790953.1 preprotein translocase subunit YajC [Rikenellaceae bacterium]MBQ8745214.1 preprotein translocase subunit YajC [Rikenellaceae bacterium]